LHGRNLHHLLDLSIHYKRVEKAERRVERCYKIIWEGGILEAQINNKAKSDLEKQLSDKYLSQANKQIEDKYLESNYIHQEK